MMTASPSESEAKRLKYLDWLQLVGSPQAPEFDAIVQLAADILDCPIALVSIVGKDQQWFKAKHGLDVDATPRQGSFCDHAIKDEDLFVIEDAHLDPRFCNSPLVTGDPNIRFYAGAPISTDGVTILGTLCVIDRKPRVLTPSQTHQLRLLGKTVEGLLRAFESERIATDAALETAKKAKQAERSASLLDRVTEVSGVGGWELSFEDRTLFWTDQTKRIHEVPLDYHPTLDAARSFYEPGSAIMVSTVVDQAIKDQTGWDVEAELITASGRKIWINNVGRPMVADNKVIGLIGTCRDITDRKAAEFRLRCSEALAREKRTELRTILDRMDQAVSVFDRDGKLTTWNQNYIDIFNKADGEIREGVSLEQLVTSAQERGDFKGDVGAYIDTLYSRLAVGETVSTELRLSDGRVVSSAHCPMPDGGWVGTHTDISERVRTHERIKHASLHDALTRLPNRIKLEDSFKSWLAETRAEGSEVALAMLDLNKFKAVNDTFGHHIGDKLLQQVAKRLQKSVRAGDLVARLGGDEFAILLKCPAENADFVLHRVADVIVQMLTKPFYVDDLALEIGCSIGISKSNGEIKSYELQMQQSDAAMYQVKRSGQSGYGFFRPN